HQRERAIPNRREKLIGWRIVAQFECGPVGESLLASQGLLDISKLEPCTDLFRSQAPGARQLRSNAGNRLSFAFAAIPQEFLGLFPKIFKVDVGWKLRCVGHSTTS